MELMIKDIIGSDIASDNEQGDLIYNKIVSGVDNHEKQIFLDFYYIKLITTDFLNKAIGKLYKR